MALLFGRLPDGILEVQTISLNYLLTQNLRLITVQLGTG